MSTTMRAAVLHDIKDLRVEDFPKPTNLGPDDVLVHVKYNGLCGTDASEYAKNSMLVPLKIANRNSKHQGATILGHEFIGTVVEAGSNAQEMIGQRVACGAGVSCGQCALCKVGRTNLCDNYYTLGLSIHGGLAEYAVAPKNICIPIPGNVSDESAALAQPLAVGIHGVRRAGVKKGDQVILLGVGAIGSFVCVALQNYGVEIIAMDIDQKRLDVAKQLGADKTILISTEITPAEVKELFPTGVDVVFETSGAPNAAARGLALAKKGGILVLMGLNKTPQEFPFVDAVLREVVLQTTAAHICKEDIPEALSLLASGTIANLLTDRIYTLENVKEAFDVLVAGKANGKILVTPQNV
jgi:2-desacetyl-2-hydroxyethyl bacteriochlorophyllide A dehydrogenase